MDLPMKLVIEIPIYRKTSKKLQEMVNRLAECRIGRVKYNVAEKNFVFESYSSKSKFRISDVYFRNPNGEVEFEKFQKFRSIFNLILSIADEETDISLELVPCSEEIQDSFGIYSNLALTLTTTSVSFFRQITQHMELLGIS